MHALSCIVLLVSLATVYGWGYERQTDELYFQGYRETTANWREYEVNTRPAYESQTENRPATAFWREYEVNTRPAYESQTENRPARNYYRILRKLETLESYMNQLRQRDQYGYQDNYRYTEQWDISDSVWQLTNQSYATLAVTGTTLLLILIFFLVKLIQCCRTCCRKRNVQTNLTFHPVPTAGCFTGPFPSRVVLNNCGPRPVDFAPLNDDFTSTDVHLASHETDTKPLLAHEVDVGKIQHV